MKIKERKEICLILNDINVHKKIDMIKTRKIN
jgi:hypothetical protein